MIAEELIRHVYFAYINPAPADRQIWTVGREDLTRVPCLWCVPDPDFTINVYSQKVFVPRTKGERIDPCIMV